MSDMALYLTGVAVGIVIACIPWVALWWGLWR